MTTTFLTIPQVCTSVNMHAAMQGRVGVNSILMRLRMPVPAGYA